MSVESKQWKSQRDKLKRDGTFATIGKVYVNNTTKPVPFAGQISRQESKPVLLPLSRSRTKAALPRVVRRARIVDRKPRPFSKSEPDAVIKVEEDSKPNLSALHALSAHSFAARQTLFSDFPMPKKGMVSHALEYFLNVCAPPALGQPPGWDWRSGGKSEYVNWYIQNIVTSDILFELIVAYSVALRLYLAKDLEGSYAQQAVAFHTQNAMQRLRLRLSRGDAYQDDALVWSVVLLCGTTYILQEIDAFKAHARGLQQMVSLRGGSDKLDKFGFLKMRLINIESSLAATQEHQRKGMIANTTLVYPQQPFSQVLLRKLSKFPPGFAELPFRISLSENLIDFIEHNIEAIRNPSEGLSMINGVHVTDWILSLPLPKHERLIALALLTNALRVDRLRRAQTAVINNYRIQKEFAKLIETEPELGSDFIQWALVTLQRTVRFSPDLIAWVNSLLTPLDLNDDHITDLEARYMPIAQVAHGTKRQPDEI
jgi:hypothetical protein